MRHGVQSADGPIAGELSPGTYFRLMAGILRKNFVAAAVGGAESDVEAAVTSGASGTFTSAATATWLTDGLKVGDVGRWTGWTTTGVDNNARNFLITALTELVMTGTFLDGDPVDPKVAGDAVTFTGVGKKTWTPATGHTEDWFTVEHYFSDLDLSEVFYDAKPDTMAIKLPASGMATIDIGMMALQQNRLVTGTSPWFTSVLAATTSGVLASVNGVISVGGNQIALLTGIDFDIAAGLTSEAVVGSNIKPDLHDGRIQVTGNMTVFFADATMRDYFADETEVAVSCAFTDSNDGDADFIAFTMPRVKLGGATKDDGEKGIIQTIPFTALFNGDGDDGVTTTVGSIATTLSIQDSTVA
ncbi:hypothetical protein KAR91_26130 [Candidatus Pacearchaeota archaeon]|nr:hypothetical protein [Candidatus Pacearchaeota archaeon]